MRRELHWARALYYVLSVPLSTCFILGSRKICPEYRMTSLKKLWLGFRMFWNTLRIPTASSYKVHLAMALKILETPSTVVGDVIECGTWKGGSAANLSLICQITGRRLRIFDSFEGLPQGKPWDREAAYYTKGDYAGNLEEVRNNIRRYGALQCCDFIKGWFKETLPTLSSPVLLAWLDVDLEESFEVCVRNLWPQLLEQGFIFIDECINLNVPALFWSERWWKRHFDRRPPGLLGAGTGLPLGGYYVGPLDELNAYPFHQPSSGAWVSKSMFSHWTYNAQETP